MASSMPMDRREYSSKASEYSVEKRKVEDAQGNDHDEAILDIKCQFSYPNIATAEIEGEDSIVTQFSRIDRDRNYSSSVAFQHKKTHLGWLVLGAMGVVFGDIGTSPLYALKVSVEASGCTPESDSQSIRAAVFGILSLITWALILVVTVKYIMIVMLADNNGEGGVLSLSALLGQKLGQRPQRKWLVTVMGLVGGSLFFGDSLITPAISVLSAVEGLEILSPGLEEYVEYIAMFFIMGLFFIQQFGTAKVAAMCGPIMAVWFVTLATLGLSHILHLPEILHALNPYIGLRFVMEHADVARNIMGSVVLAVTGGEALYADMGHFGRTPIQCAWLFVVFPSLLLNYYGQGAMIISHPATLSNPFFNLAPEWMLIPLLGLSFLATIIASQAVISGAFSITNQAIQLGYIPRLRVLHTSADEIDRKSVV